jgi:hypothetical protein
MELQNVRWFTHPTDPTADVAIMRGMPASATFKPMVLQTDDFATSDHFAQGKIGVGDEIVMAGLFTMHPGFKQHIPILRHGQLAMAPVEPVETEHGPVDAYLVEARSIGGLSGSPVFISETVMPTINGQSVFAAGPAHLLGLLRGHWRFEVPTAGDLREERSMRQVNAGIAMVTPAQKILDTIHQPEVLAMNEAELKDGVPQKIYARQVRIEQAVRKSRRSI